MASKTGKLPTIRDFDRPAVVLDAVLGLDRIAASLRAVVRAGGQLGQTTSVGGVGGGAVGLTDAAGVTLASVWSAVHAVVSVPLPARPSTGFNSQQHHVHQHRMELFDPEDVTVDPATRLFTQTVPQLLAGVIVGMATIPGDHVLAPLRVMGTLLGGAVQVDPGVSQLTMRLLSSVDTNI